MSDSFALYYKPCCATTAICFDAPRDVPYELCVSCYAPVSTFLRVQIAVCKLDVSSFIIFERINGISGLPPLAELLPRMRRVDASAASTANGPERGPRLLTTVRPPKAD